MNEEVEYFMFSEENLNFVLSSFFNECVKGNILDYVPMEEIIESFNKQYTVEDGHYELSEPEMLKFIDDMCKIFVDRLMIDMDKKELATLGYGNGEFCLIAKK